MQILAAQQTPTDDRWFQGTADAVRRNLQVLTSGRADLVLIVSGDHLYRMDYRAMLREHLEGNADVTVSVLPCSAEEIGSFGAVRVDEQERIVEFREKPRDEAAREGMEFAPALRERNALPADRPYLASMGIYLFDKTVLCEALENDLADFGHHVHPALRRALPRKGAPVQGLLAGHRLDPLVLRGAHGHGGPHAAVRLLRSGVAVLHASALPAGVAGERLPVQPLDPGRRGDRAATRSIEDSIVGVRQKMQQGHVRRTLMMGGGLPAARPRRVAAGRASARAR